MAFTRLPERSCSRDMVDVFRGYNHNLKLSDGEFYEMTNMSADHYPLAAVRGPRGTWVTDDTWLSTEKCSGIIMKDRLCWVEGEYFVYGDYRLGMGLTRTTPDKPKQLISMGAYVIILPDRKYVNTADLADYGDIDAEYTTIDPTSISLCRANGEEYTNEYIGDTEPEDPANLSVWVDTSQYPNRLMQWSEVSQVWTQVTVSTVKLFSLGLGTQFQAGDGVTISGIKGAAALVDDDTNEPLTEKQREQVEALEGAAVILDRGDDWIVISGIMDAHVRLTGVFTVSRKMPEMDFVVEHHNRLWGCRYGLDAGGEFVNMLYASALGDFRNWTSYQGIDADSYFANVGSDGPFTGAISYGDSVIFSKENAFHAVYGDAPSTFQVQQIACRGVQKGSSRSMAIVGGVLYYKSATGVCAYDGSLPVEVSECLGNVRYQGAAAGSCGSKYYISMQEVKTGQYHLFAYDTERGLWHREDGTQASMFADGGDEAFYLEVVASSGTGVIRTIGGTGAITEGQVKWAAQTGIIGADYPDRKRLRSLNVRLSMAMGSRMRVLVRYDSTGAWQQVGSLTGQGLRAVSFPVRVRRCDHMELRLEGVGDCKLHAIVKTYETGSDRR